MGLLDKLARKIREQNMIGKKVKQAEKLMAEKDYKKALELLNDALIDAVDTDDDVWYEEAAALEKKCIQEMNHAGENHASAPTPEPKAEPKPAPSSPWDAAAKMFTEEEAAYEQCRAAAESGDPDAQYRLGEMYLCGTGVNADAALAIRWLRAAAEQGHAEAQYLLGVQYRKGNGVTQDKAEGEKWYRLAAEQGHQEAWQAVNTLNRLAGKPPLPAPEPKAEPKVEPKPAAPAPAPAPKAKAEPKPEPKSTPAPKAEEAKEVVSESFRKLAAKNPQMMFFLGRAAEKEKNYDMAAKYYRAAAEQGYTDAQLYLGFLYNKGHGVAKSETEAAQWFRTAAEHGNPNAQLVLGIGYNHGNGVPQDHAQAAKWLRAAAEQGNANAQFELGLLYYKGNGVAENYTEAVKWYRAAAEQDYGPAQHNLACALAVGKGVKEDIKEAIRWANREKRTYARAGNRDGVQKAEDLLKLLKEHPSLK